MNGSSRLATITMAQKKCSILPKKVAKHASILKNHKFGLKHASFPINWKQQIVVIFEKCALSDALSEGIGALVDADIEEASARLQSLQVQQQLGIQALSIANQQPQQLLALFR